MSSRLFPRAWRERYGEELDDLVAAMSGGRTPWRIRADLVRAAAREWLRPRDGALLVLEAWALFVLAGCVVQKVSEHWQDDTSATAPAVAFVVLVGLAVVTSILVVGAIALTLPRVARSEWRRTRGAVLVTAALAAATVVLVVWPGLASALAWVLLAVACLIAWTAAAVAIGRRVTLPEAIPALAVAVTGAMAAMTASTIVFAVAMPYSGTDLARLGVAAGAMALATAMGAAGTRQALAR